MMRHRKIQIAALLCALALLPTLTACTQSSPTVLVDKLDGGDILASLKSELSSIPTDYSTDDAVKDGCFVVLHGILMSLQSIADDFVAASQVNQEATLMIVQYTIEGDPIITNLFFDGGVFHGVVDYTRDFFKGSADYTQFTYDYLHVFNADDRQHVCLSNDPDMTWERIMAHIQCPDSEDQIDWHLLYSMQK